MKAFTIIENNITYKVTKKSITDNNKNKYYLSKSVLTNEYFLINKKNRKPVKISERIFYNMYFWNYSPSLIDIVKEFEALNFGKTILLCMNGEYNFAIRENDKDIGFITLKEDNKIEYYKNCNYSDSLKDKINAWLYRFEYRKEYIYNA